MNGKTKGDRRRDEKKILTLKESSRIAADDTFIFFYFYLSKKLKLDILCESSAQQIHMKF